jgi:hypothetical protein
MDGSKTILKNRCASLEFKLLANMLVASLTAFGLHYSGLVKNNNSSQLAT